MSDLRFISIVKENEILYNNIDSVNYSKQLKLWDELAKEFQLKNGQSAHRKWQELRENYIFFLRGGENESFPYATAMQFIQPFLVSERQDEGSHSDLEMDETEMERILNSDEELEPSNIESHAESNEPSHNSSNMDEKNFEVKEVCFKSTEILQNVSLSTNNSSSKAASQSATTLNNLSSLELIFLGYARELQKMPLALQLQTKRKIADIMNEAEMKILTY